MFYDLSRLGRYTDLFTYLLSANMEHDSNKTEQPRIPSDIRVYFIVLALAVTMFAVLWLLFRFL